MEVNMIVPEPFLFSNGAPICLNVHVHEGFNLFLVIMLACGSNQ